MKKERQIGIRVGVPAFFALELEDVYKHCEGAHRALAFPDFVGLLVGIGLEQYRKGKALPETEQEEAPDNEDGEGRQADPLHLFDINPERLPEMFSDFDEAMDHRKPPEIRPHLRVVNAGELA